jgi:glycosyltransferase involved in cell wall biosynthesis
MALKKLAILTTHPIQYYAPVFRMLSERKNIEIKVFYSWGETSLKKYDPGFGRVIEWDIPLLDGYEYEFLENSSTDPGTHHFYGILNPRIKQQIEVWKPDTVLVIGWNYHSHLRALRHFHGRLPVLFRGDSNLLDEVPGWKKIARRLALTWVYRYVDIALYTGSANKQYFVAHGLKENQLIFAPHAVENERFTDNETRRYAERALSWRREIGFSDEDIVLLFAGKLEPKKGIDLLLETFMRIDNSKMKLLIVGSGDAESKLKATAAKDTRVHFLPFQNQTKMPVVYRLGDIFCLPSRGPGETWGLAVNEAMACSKAVLVSDRCGCAADLVKDGENGYIFQSGNPDSLSDKIRLLYTSGLQNLRHFGLKSGEIIKEWSIGRLTDAITNSMQPF